MHHLRKAPSLPQTILAILYEIGTGTVKSFFPHPYYHTFCEHKDRRSFHSATKRLRDSGLIAKNSKNIFYLTNKGAKEAFFAFINAEVSNKKYASKNRQKWDGKWRIILFDIPEKKKSKREYLRNIIRTMGFKEFQKSIWIYPHKIPDFLIELLNEASITPYVRFITTQNIDYQEDLIKLFNL